MRVVLLEDVITTGGSTRRVLERVEQAGRKVVRVVALVDRQEGRTRSGRGQGAADGALRAAGLPLMPSVRGEMGRRGSCGIAVRWPAGPTVPWPWRQPPSAGPSVSPGASSAAPPWALRCCWRVAGRACPTRAVRGAAPSYRAEDYRTVLQRWTRHGSKTNIELTKVLDVYATFRCWDFPLGVRRPLRELYKLPLRPLSCAKLSSRKLAASTSFSSLPPLRTLPGTTSLRMRASGESPWSATTAGRCLHIRFFECAATKPVVLRRYLMQELFSHPYVVRFPRRFPDGSELSWRIRAASRCASPARSEASTCAGRWAAASPV